MKINFENQDLSATIDALEFAIAQIHWDIDQCTLNALSAAKAIAELQILRTALMLAQRNAAGEQRKGRANQTDVIQHRMLDKMIGHIEG